MNKDTSNNTKEKISKVMSETTQTSSTNQASNAKQTSNINQTSKMNQTSDTKQTSESKQIYIAKDSKYKNDVSVPNFAFSINRLQEAVIWTEILGKPISKRRKRR
ncbi:MAG: hypothetical protein K0S41_4143 [Anaerocolumna sp.]|jgi:primase-polymerase (primpol)-like protein|nr:hypothetical protein [Anaerocolumna sp.]